MKAMNLSHMRLNLLVSLNVVTMSQHIFYITRPYKLRLFCLYSLFCFFSARLVHQHAISGDTQQCGQRPSFVVVPFFCRDFVESFWNVGVHTKIWAAPVIPGLIVSAFSRDNVNPKHALVCAGASLTKFNLVHDVNAIPSLQDLVKRLFNFINEFRYCIWNNLRNILARDMF